MPLERKPLRILMVLESPFPIFGGGGAESQVRTLACELRRIGHRVTILTPRFAEGPQRVVERCFGIPVCRLAYPRVRGLGSIVLWMRLLAFLWRRRRHYDAWHVHIAHYLGAICCALGRRLGVPVVVKISGQWELGSGLLVDGGGIGVRIARHLLKSASVYQAISRRIGSELVARGMPATRIVALPNAVDVRRFRVSQKAPRAQRPLTAVYVGRLQQHKGLDTLLSGWARAFAARADVQLLLVGRGEDEPKLRAQTGQLGIANQVQFLGHRDDVEQVLASADFALLPSLIEGLSNSLLEFMASGLAVVATRVSGSEDLIVPDRNGWLFPVGDVDALALCLREVAALPEEKLIEMGRAARRDVEAAAGLESVVARLLSLYRGASPSTPGLAFNAAPIGQGH